MILTKSKNLKVLTILFTLIAATSAMAQEGDSSTQEERRAAFDECLSSLGIEKPAQGQRPQAMDESVREQIGACMKEKGFDPPTHRRGEGPPPEGARGGFRGGNSSSSNAVNGVQ
jgi:hypothetical protein